MFDGGFIEAGSIKITLEMEYSLYDKVLWIERYFEQRIGGLFRYTICHASMYGQRGTASGTSVASSHSWATSIYWVSREATP